MSIWIGIDVSKNKLDCAWTLENKKNHIIVSNNKVGFNKMLKECPDDSKFVMEATGTYYLNCALFLNNNKYHVSVENPYRIKNHMRSDMNRAKNDKIDAISIAKFGIEKNPEPWFAISKDILKIQQLRASLSLIVKQIVALKNQIHAFSQSDFADKDTIRMVSQTICYLEKKKKILGDKMIKVAKANFKEEFNLIISIPGIGEITTASLLGCIMDFNRFPSSRHLISFLGLSPTNRQSGSSLNLKGKICKMGNSDMRSLLYVCSSVAIQYNEACRNMFFRQKERGKQGNVPMVCVMNKLVKQIYGVVKSKTPYSKEIALGSKRIALA